MKWQKSLRITQACTLKKVHNKPLKYQTTIWMYGLNGLTKTTTMKQYRPESRTREATIYGGKVSKCNASDEQEAFRPIPGLLSCAVNSTCNKIFWNIIDIRYYYFSNVHALRYGYIWYTGYQRPYPSWRIFRISSCYKWLMGCRQEWWFRVSL